MVVSVVSAVVSEVGAARAAKGDRRSGDVRAFSGTAGFAGSEATSTLPLEPPLGAKRLEARSAPPSGPAAWLAGAARSVVTIAASAATVMRRRGAWRSGRRMVPPHE